MSRDIDPFAEDAKEYRDSSGEDLPVNNRLGMSNVRQALSRWWIMLIFGVLGYCGALYFMSIMPPSTTANAVLEIDMKRKQLIGAELESNAAKSGMLMTTEASKLAGPGNLVAVANSVDVQALQKVMPPKFSLKPRYMRTEEELAYKPATSVEVADLVKVISKSLTIEIRPKTTLIDIMVEHPDPESARVIADQVMRSYIEAQELEMLGGSEGAYKTLKVEADETLVKIEDAEKAFQLYAAAIKFSDMIQQERPQIVSTRQRYLAKHPKRVRSEHAYADLIKRFAREIKRSSAKSSEVAYWLQYKDQLDSLEEAYNAGGEGASEAVDEWVQLAQSVLATRANLLRTTANQLQSQWQSITKRMTEIDVADEGAMSKLSVIEPAFVGATADSMRINYLAIGSVLGVISGFCIAYILSVIDYKIYDVRSAEEATGLTCMAAVPASSKFGRKDKWESVLQHDPHSANAEAIRNLRASVVLLGKQERNKVLLVTSAIPGEGKTTISAELASAFALNKERTLLVDMDLRRPKLTESFPHLKGAPGIVEVLAGQAELENVFHDTSIDHLKVIGSGDKAPNPSELLHEGEFVEILEKLRPQFDRIILDSAPVLPVADSRLLAKHAQSVILVVRSRKTPIGAMMRARDLLKFAGAKVGGVVVNGMKRTGGSKYHGYKGFGEYGQESYGYYGGDE